MGTFSQFHNFCHILGEVSKRNQGNSGKNIQILTHFCLILGEVSSRNQAKKAKKFSFSPILVELTSKN